MSSSSSSSTSSTPAASAALSPGAAGEMMAVLVVVLFLFFIITLVLYLRAKRYPGTIGYSRRVRRPLVPAPEPATPLRRPLDPSVLDSLPVAVVRLEPDQSGPDECAVCLSEFGEGEEARFLPGCNHGFHVECIDMWFASNSTCPLCRLAVDVSRACHVASSDEGSPSTCSECSSSQEKQEEGMVVMDIEREGEVELVVESITPNTHVSNIPTN